MKKNLLIISALLFTLIVPIANSECIYPKKSFKFPNGSKASESVMIEAQTNFKAWQAVAETYRSCLENELASIPKESESFSDLDEMMTAKYNASIEEEKQLADDWNSAVRAYQSK
jgi:hypothetical protein